MHQAIRQKVAHLTSVHPPSDTRIAFRECATLAESGYDVVLVAPGPVPRLPPGVRMRPVPAPRNRFERVTRTIWAVYRAALSERADVYHFHDPELMGVGLALRMRGARVVFDIHEDIPKDINDKPWIPPPLRKPAAIAARLVLQALQRRFSAIVTATPGIARTYEHPCKIIVANYPRLDEIVAGESRPFERREPTVLYVGELTALRGAAQMVQAMRHVPEPISLSVVGPFEDSILEQRLCALAEWKRVVYLGRRHRYELPAIFGNACAGLLIMLPAANHVDALPTKVFEYMATGLPVIVSNAVPLSVDIVRKHECGIVVDPLDGEQIASAIQYCVQNRRAAQEMGERGRRAALENYQWNSEGTKLTQLYAQLA